MGLISYKPTTPSFRKTVKIDRSSLFKGRPEKSLVEDLQPNSGRNNTGKITIRHRSGGHKKKYRLVNFKRNTFDKIGTIERIEHDPNRSAFIALVNYQDDKEYILAPSDIKVGDKVLSSLKTEISSGNAMKIKNIPTGTSIHNIELKPGAGGKLCRSAGSFAQVLGTQDNYIMVKLSSRETRLIHGECMATIGVVSNQDNKNKKITFTEDVKENISYIGLGFDIHRLVKNKKLYLGGIKIPYHSGLKGHSDGDVILHAIIDALLGAIRKKDIGTFFPDNKNKFKNIRSPNMLKPILEILEKDNFYINNLDINLICEKPKVSKYREKIINSLSHLLNLDKNLINLKGKTVEKLGLIGKEKAIACEVICSISQ